MDDPMLDLRLMFDSTLDEVQNLKKQQFVILPDVHELTEKIYYLVPTIS